MIEHYKNDADGLCTKLVKALCNEKVKENDDLCVISEQELEVS